MKKFSSITGWVLAAVFLLFAGVVYFGSVGCHGISCMGRIVPVIPWFFFFGLLRLFDVNIEQSTAGYAWYTISVLVNAAILYSIGAAIENAIRKYRESQKTNTGQK